MGCFKGYVYKRVEQKSGNEMKGSEFYVFRVLPALFMMVAFALSTGSHHARAEQLIVPDSAKVSLQRQIDDPGAKAILVVRAGAAEKNCADVRSLATKIALVGKTLTVQLIGFKNDSRTAGTTNLCAVARIGMDAERLETAKVNKVEFVLNGQSNVYEFQLSPTALRMVPTSTAKTILPDESYDNVLDPLYFWRMPSNTVALFTQNVKDPNIQMEIEQFAQQKGMTKMSEAIPNFVPRYKEKDRFLFVDNEGIVTQLLKDDPEIALGSMSFARMVRKGTERSRKVFTERIYAKRVTIMD